jgi:mevalonate kinase
MIEASAPAKIILFGEHAVVYGQPAIAVPVSSLRAIATVQENQPPGQGLCIHATDLNKTSSLNTQVDDALQMTARLVLQALDAPTPDVTITLRAQIPMASGLGSGAAVATALARALSMALLQPLDNPTLNNLVYEVEKIHHGTPSGIDNTVIVYEQPVYFIRDQPIQSIQVGSPLRLLIANTGQSALTRIAVGDVRKLYDAEPARIQPILEQIGTLVKRARGVIESGDVLELGPLMLENHTLLQTLTVSSIELDALVNAAMNSGAAGAKLSGGGRGGNMIALVSDDTAHSVKQALLKAGATDVIETIVQ